MCKPTELIFCTCLLNEQLSLYEELQKKENIQISHFFQGKKKRIVLVSNLFHIFHKKIKAVIVKIL